MANLKKRDKAYKAWSFDGKQAYFYKVHECEGDAEVTTAGICELRAVVVTSLGKRLDAGRRRLAVTGAFTCQPPNLFAQNLELRSDILRGCSEGRHFLLLFPARSQGGVKPRLRCHDSIVFVPAPHGYSTNPALSGSRPGKRLTSLLQSIPI